VAAASGKTFETTDPSTEQVICRVAEGGREDVDRAVNAAHQAFYQGDWSRLTPMARETLLLKWADLV
jgi:acyl-CoA reductase-like NAD-dependent aldehyde dehydrogenase